MPFFMPFQGYIQAHHGLAWPKRRPWCPPQWRWEARCGPQAQQRVHGWDRVSARGGGLVRQPSYAPVIWLSALSSSSAEPVGIDFAWAKQADL